MGGPRVRRWAPPPGSPACPTPGPAGRTPRSPRTISATTCATCSSCTTSTATSRRRCTGTSGRAACTPGSRSTCVNRRRHRRRSGRSSSGPPTWWCRYGGSFSGEHGDGQARGELLPKMFGDDLVRAFGQFKAIFDPDDRMNPGKVVAAEPARRPAAPGRRLQPRRRRHPLPLPRRRGQLRPGRAALRRRRQVPPARARRGHVPVLHGHPGGGALHPRAGPGCCSRCSTAPPAAARSPTAGAPTRSRTPSTCAWPARAARPTARSTSTWPPTRPSSCPTTTQGRLRPRAHYSMGWLPVAAAAVAATAPRPGQRAVARARPGLAGQEGGRRRHAPRHPALRRRRPSSTGSPAAPRAAAASAARWCCGRTPSPTTSTRASPGPRSRCWRPPAGG